MAIFKFAFFIFLIFISSVFMVQRTGLLHPEALERIPNYLDERNLFQKVYDIDRNEYGLYQARELSHFFDYIDANFIKLSVLIGLSHFFSLTYFISIFSIIVLSLYISRANFNHKNFLAPSLIILIFLFSPVTFFSTYMFRSAKVLVALGIILTFFSAARYLSQKSNKFKIGLVVIASTLFLAFADRQGFYILLSFAGFVILNFLFFKKKKYLNLFKLLTVGTFISLFYSYLAAPLLIKINLGHFPNFSYHKIDFQLAKPIFFRYSTLYSLDIFKYFFGNLNRFLALFFLLNFITIYIVNQAKKIEERLKYVALILLAIFSILILNTLLILKHNAIPLEEVRRVYYSLPLSAIILLAALFLSGTILKNYPKAQKYLSIALFLIVILNILAIDGHYQIVKNGLLKDDYDASTKIIECINSKQDSNMFNPLDDMRSFCLLIRK